MNWFSVCDVSCGQVFTLGIRITKVYEVVSCAQMYAVCGCVVLDEQRSTTSCGTGTPVNRVLKEQSGF